MKFDLTTFNTKKFIKIFVVLAVCVFIFVVYINVVINPKKIKNNLNSFFETELAKYSDNYNLKDRELKIHISGNIDFKLFPKSFLKINGVELRNIFYKNLSINSNIREILIKVKFLPLLFGKISIENVFINNARYEAEINELLNEYKVFVKEDKVVDIEKNEVSGIGSKLKNIIGTNDDEDRIKDGKKVVQVDVEKTINIDNTKLNSMLPDIFLSFNKNFFDNNGFKNSKVTILQNDFTLYKNKVVIRDIKNIDGDIDIARKTTINLGYVFNQERFNNKIVISKSKNGNTNLKLIVNSNNFIKSFNANFIGTIKELLNINTWNGFLNIEAVVTDVYEFLNTINSDFQNNSNFVLNKNNKDQFNISGKLKLENGDFKSDNITISSNNLKLATTFNKNKNNYDINTKISFLNVNNVFAKNNDYLINENNNKNRNIFIYNNESIESIANKLNDSNNTENDKKIKITISNDELIFNNITFKNNNADITIDNGNVSFNKLELNNKDYSLNISNPKLISNIYVNDFHMHVNSTKNSFLKFNWAKNLDINENFNIDGKLIISSNLLIFKDSILNSNNNDIKFDLEYGFSNDKYTAVTLKVDKFSLKDNFEKDSSIKQRLLFLNNLSDNFYINLSANELKYNDNTFTNFKTELKTNFGYLLLKNTNFNSNKINNFKGNIELDITKNSPNINMDIYIGNYDSTINLIPYIINTDKYTNIFQNSKTNEQKNEKYWVNKLFSLPSFENINGKINLKINSININGVYMDKMVFNSNIEDGNFKINNLNCDLKNGKLGINGNFILKDSERGINLKIDKNIYSLEEINKLITNSNNTSLLSGLIGIGGYFSANGSNVEDFSSSISNYFEFVGNNIFVKNFGLGKLRENLTNIHLKKDLLYKINPKDVLLKENNGTLFKKVNGKFYSQLSIYKSEIEATGDGISNKFNLTVNNSNNETTIDFLNTSAMIVLVNKVKIPLYAYISYKENIKDKATLDFNLSSIDEYIEKIKNKINEAEQKRIKEKQERDLLLEKQRDEEFIKTEGTMINDITENLNN